MKMRLTAIALAAIGLSLAPTTARACNVPVFRYALERWPSDHFEAVVFHRGPLAGVDHRRVEAMKSAVAESHANVVIRTVDLDAKVADGNKSLWNAQSNAPVPWLVLRAPASEDGEPSLASGRVGEIQFDAWLDSPARRELTKRLLNGESVVWMLVESGDEAKDEQVATLLTNELKQLETTLKLPPPAPDDPPPRLPVPVRIAFSIQRVARGSAEAPLIQMLLHGDKLADGPVIVPVFGRGRVLAAFSGAEISSKLLQQASAFLCGACSCEVKEMNPGRDLLLAVNWDASFTTPAVETKTTSIAAGARVPIAPGTVATKPTDVPNPQRGMRLLASVTLAFVCIIVLLIGIAMLRSLRR
jgi:hypothetical protein